MAHVKTNFSAQNNGFRFANRFEFQFPARFSLPLAGSINLGDVVYGLCGGMCFSALDYYNSQIPLPAYTQVAEIDPKLFIYLCDRQLDSLRLPVLLKVIQWMLSEDKDIALRMARYEIPRLRRMLDRGNPVVLALIRVQGAGDPTKNHQVLATGYELDPGTKRMRIHLYDPNHPGLEPAITLNLAKPGAGLELAQSTGEPLRGFFIIDYRPQKIIPRSIAPQPVIGTRDLREIEQFKLRWPVDSQRVNQFFGDNPDTYRPFGLPGHEGLDLYAPSSHNIYAAADGEVYEVRHPKDHPYGLQIRIKHVFGNKVYKTIYAHLSKTAVQVGQKVSSGDLIGYADNTGNSFGSHLHLTLKIDGEQTPGYPAGIVDPWPYFQNEPPPPPGPLPPLSGLTVYTSGQINLRARPNTDSQILAGLPAGEALAVLGDADSVRPKIGQQGEWLQILTASGQAGYVAAWLVQSIEQAFPPSDLVVYPIDAVNLRAGPATGFEVSASLSATDPLTVLGDADNARLKIGRQGEWLQVQTESGQRGFVAAWLVHTTGQPLPSSDLVVYATEMLNVRARPSIDSNRLTVVTPADPLAVLGDRALALAHIGQMDQWLNVRTPEKYSGYVAAWLVRQAGGAPPPEQVSNGLTVYPTADINLRAQPSINSPRITGALCNEPLIAVEADLNAARDKVGKMDAWMHVQKQDGSRGWAAAWYLSLAS